MAAKAPVSEATPTGRAVTGAESDAGAEPVADPDLRLCLLPLKRSLTLMLSVPLISATAAVTGFGARR